MALKDKMSRETTTEVVVQREERVQNISTKDAEGGSCSILCFDEIYSNKKYYVVACKVLDDFVNSYTELDAKMNNDREAGKLGEIKYSDFQKLKEKTIRDILPKHVAKYPDISKATIKAEVIDFVVDHLMYYGPITTVTNKAGIDLNDILVNTKDHIDVIYKGKTVNTPYRFRSEAELLRIINRMLAENGRKVDQANPIVSSKLRDGSRIEVQIPPIAANVDENGEPGSYVTIRKFRDVPLLFESLIDGAQMDFKMAYFLLKAIEGKLNIIVSGGTSSGKTTFLNAMTRFIDEGDQLLTIEDTKEMKPQMPCHSARSFEARQANEEGEGEVPIERLLRTALRSAPRRIIVGECRGGEIIVMLNAMNTGHPGSMTTVHADDTKEAVVRIENMFLEAQPTANSTFVKTQIVSAVDLIVQLVRFPDGTRRVTKISEPEKRVEEGGVVSILDIFEFERKVDKNNPLSGAGTFKTISTPMRSLNKMLHNGVELDKSIFDPNVEITKDMLVNELKKYKPSKERICGWQESYMAEIIKDSYKDGKNIVDRWPNLK